MKKQINKQKNKLQNYQIPITPLFENQTRMTQKSVMLFHKHININVIHMSEFHIFMLKYL